MPAHVIGFLTDPTVPNITPNTDGLPGVSQAEKMIGALMTYGVLAAVAALIIAAIVWAFGGNHNNPQWAQRGKNGVLIALASALVIGGALGLVSFFTSVGATLQP